jgi:murein DD-endopeptidase MepM/ murein hydrolase activator NlpD
MKNLKEEKRSILGLIIKKNYLLSSRKSVLVFICLFLFAFLASSFSETLVLQALSGDIFELKFRKLQPGEPVIFSWLEKKSSLITIFFLGKSYLLKNEMEKNQFMLLGVDLAEKPGEKNLEVTIWENNQEKERLSASVEILARDFPRKELTVDQKYVTPPKEVQERIRREAEILAQIYSLTSPDWLVKGPFTLPCEGDLYPNFGQQRIYNNVPRSIHSGVDIAVPRGHPIKAANSGLVVLASDLYFSGKTVIIDHGLGLFSSYSHLSKLLAKRGERVNKGQVIGLAGSTGLATGPHLHWAVKINEARVDPLALLELEF